MYEEFGDMTIVYNSLISIDEASDYQNLLKKFMKLKYFYKTSTHEKPLEDDGSTTFLMANEIRKQKTIAKDKDRIIQDLENFIFTKLQFNYDFVSNNMEHQKFISYPSIIYKNGKRSYIYSEVTIFSNCLIEFNMYTVNNLFSVFEDYTVGLSNCHLQYFSDKHNSYIDKHIHEETILTIGRMLSNSILKYIFNKNLDTLFNSTTANFNEYSYYICNGEINENAENFKKYLYLTHSPLDRNNVENLNFDKENIKTFHNISYYATSIASFLFTSKSYEYPEQNPNSINNNAYKFFSIYLNFSVSATPILIDKLIDQVILTYYTQPIEYSKKDINLLHKKINNIRIAKKNYIAPDYRTINSLSYSISKFMRPHEEIDSINTYLTEINSYLELEFKNESNKSNKRIQLLLLIISFITILPILLNIIMAIIN